MDQTSNSDEELGALTNEDRDKTSPTPSKQKDAAVQLIPLASSSLTSYLPQYLYCGECVSCQCAPPPSVSENKLLFYSQKARPSQTRDLALFDEEHASPSGVEAASNLTSQIDDDLYGKVRSSFFIANFTCPSQLLIIRSIGELLHGVYNLVMPTLHKKILLVDHEGATISAEQIASALRLHGYDAQVQTGSASLTATSLYSSPCRSQIVLTEASPHDITFVESTLERTPGVFHIASINPMTLVVYVDHDPAKITADQLCEVLNDHAGGKNRLGAKVKFDGGTAKRVATEKKSSSFEAVQQRVVRSHLLILSGLCCSSEVPTIKNIVSSLPGVQSVKVNPATKVVIVDYDANYTNASSIAQLLITQGFRAEVKRDGGAEATAKAAVAAVAKRFHVSQADESSAKTDICYVESIIVIPALRSVQAKESIERMLRSIYSSRSDSGVRAFTLHLSSRTCKVEHNPNLASAEQIARAIDGGLEGACRVKVETDGSVEGRTLSSLEDEDAPLLKIKEGEEGDYRMRIQWNVIFSGMFWSVSMLSVIGGNW